ACANADVASTLSAAAIKRVFFEVLFILHPPRMIFEQITNVVVPSTRPAFTTCLHDLPSQFAFTICLGPHARAIRLCDFPHGPSRLSCGFGLETRRQDEVIGMIRMNHVIKVCLGIALLSLTLVSVARADEFKLSNNQRISCSRGLSAGKLNTSTCKSYAYLFNVKTSEYFRCQVTLALTRDNKEVINVQADGGCTKKPRIFDTDSSYAFDATETEPPNTNSFFGPGGYSVWAADTTAQKIRGCITISSGLGSDISKCLDMTFQ